jgi:hypothetical protein
MQDMRFGNLILGGVGVGLLLCLGLLTWSMREARRNDVSIKTRIEALEHRIESLGKRRETAPGGGWGEGVVPKGRSATTVNPESRRSLGASPSASAERPVPIGTNDLERTFIASQAYEQARRCMLEMVPDADHAKIYFKVDENGAVTDVLVGPMSDSELRDCVVKATRSWHAQAGPATGMVMLYPDRGQ